MNTFQTHSDFPYTFYRTLCTTSVDRYTYLGGVFLIILTHLGAGIAQLVVLGLAVHSVEGSILLWGHFPVEGIFPLELTWVQTPFPQKLFQMRV